MPDLPTDDDDDDENHSDRAVLTKASESCSGHSP